MAEPKKLFLENTEPLLDDEDEATLAAIDRGIEAANEGRVVPFDEVQRRVQEWSSKSSSRKTP